MVVSPLVGWEVDFSTSCCNGASLVDGQGVKGFWQVSCVDGFRYSKGDYLMLKSAKRPLDLLAWGIGDVDMTNDIGC